MEYKGTKGGFKLNCDKYFTIQAKEYIKTIATINCVFMPIKEAKANGILMCKSYELLNKLNEIIEAIENETIIITENEDNDGYENFGGRFYQEAKQLIKEATEI